MAQTVEFYHQDLSRRLEEEANNHLRELDRLKDLVAKNNQTVSALPSNLNDRVERLIEHLERNLQHELESGIQDVKESIDQVKSRLSDYAHSRPPTQREEDGVVEAVEEDKDNVTGKFEITESGKVNLAITTSALKKLWYIVLTFAAGGGLYGLIEGIKALTSK